MQDHDIESRNTKNTVRVHSPGGVFLRAKIHDPVSHRLNNMLCHDIFSLICFLCSIPVPERLGNH